MKVNHERHENDLVDVQNGIECELLELKGMMG